MADHPTPGAATLYDEAPCALLLTQPTGEIVHANQTFFDWLGVTRGELLEGTRFQSLLSMGSRIYYETHYAPLLQMQGAVSEIALEIRRPDGSVCPVVASARQVRDAAGVPVVHHVALFDSSDRRRYEKELLEARKRAERAANELAAVDRQKNDFIAMLAHELRNPLAPVRTAVDLLRKVDTRDPIVRKASEVLQRQVEQMVRLVEDLLDITRLAQDKLAIRPLPVNLVAIVGHALEAHEPLLDRARLRLESRLPLEAIYADVDATRLTQVIANVLNNAAKFTAPGGSVTVELLRAGDEAVIRIRDTGIGIDPTQLSAVFGMFMQARPSAERKGGLGLGLTLAKSLIERHGGQISAHSEGLGKGTEFVIRLPARLAQPEGIAPAAAPHATVRVVPRRVLVVEDNHDAAELMALLLEFQGHQVRRAHDGVEALRLADVFRPEVMLLDIGLPQLDGYEVAQRIRAMPGPQPVLVALTGWGRDSDLRRSEAAGFDAHLVKPIDPDTLTTLLADLSRRASETAGGG